MNSIGRFFRIQLFGESHGKAVGLIVDGCPPGIPVDIQDFRADLARRKAGQVGTTARSEADVPELLSGLYRGYTTGSPITIVFQNEDVKSVDYELFQSIPRPGHADFVARTKYRGFSDPRGSGHFSGRLTVGIVAAGVIAKKILSGVVFSTRLVEAGGLKDIDRAIEEASKSGDSIGAVVEVRVAGLPVGYGEPFFDTVEGAIAKAVFAIPGIKGVEFGAGFACARMKGSECNDPLVNANGKTSSNNSGGINGGISNGNDVIFRVAVKPTSTIAKGQKTYDFSSDCISMLSAEGRHDVCIALRAAVAIESVTACALADFSLACKAFPSGLSSGRFS